MDLGCGNGLLTHILASEGYEGFGVDIARRKVWDHYGEGTRLVGEWWFVWDEWIGEMHSHLTIEW